MQGRWTDIFSRSVLGIEVFRVKGSRSTRDTSVRRAVRDELSLPVHGSKIHMFSPSTLAAGFLDGGWVQFDGYGLPTIPSGQWVVGYQAMRLVLDVLGVPQPRLLKGEREVPDVEALHSSCFAELGNTSVLLGWMTSEDAREIARAFRTPDPGP